MSPSPFPLSNSSKHPNSASQQLRHRLPVAPHNLARAHTGIIVEKTFSNSPSTAAQTGALWRCCRSPLSLRIFEANQCGWKVIEYRAGVLGAGYCGKMLLEHPG